MPEHSPLLFETRLGMLRPANAVAEAAMREIKGRVRVEIRGGVANQRRRGLYWSVAALVVPLLNQQHNMTLDEDDLHDITRQKLGLGHWIELPSGDRRFKPKSTSNRSMNEAERAEYTDRALELWSTWSGVEVTTLRNEAEAAWPPPSPSPTRSARSSASTSAANRIGSRMTPSCATTSALTVSIPSSSP